MTKFIHSDDRGRLITDSVTGQVEIVPDDSLVCIVPQKTKTKKFCFAFNDGLASAAYDKLSGGCYSALLLMMASADYENWVWQSQNTLAEDLEVDPGNFGKCLRKLESLGWIRKSVHPVSGKQLWQVAPQIMWRGKLKNLAKVVCPSISPRSEAPPPGAPAPLGQGGQNGIR